jgi:hypothetical protein
MAQGAVMVAGASAAAAAAARRKAIGEADAAWIGYATARGMHFRPSRTGWAHEQLPRVDGVVDGVNVAIELVHDMRTAVLAVPAVPLAGNLHIGRESVFTSIAKFFGAHDIVLGDKAFDDAFLVKASAAALAQALLSPATRAELLALGAESFAYDDGSEHKHSPMVVLFLRRIAVGDVELDRALRVVIQAASVRDGTAPYR